MNRTELKLIIRTLCTAPPDSKHSCAGRCNETFSRGKPCYCDPECDDHRICCFDHQIQCARKIITPSLLYSLTFTIRVVYQNVCFFYIRYLVARQPSGQRSLGRGFGSRWPRLSRSNRGPLALCTPGLTQPPTLKWSVNRVPACLAGVKAGCVRLCRVEGNTV